MARAAMRQIIYITGYPRSGNTWLGRLMADILGCEYNSFDGEIGDWPGDRTDAPYLVRKTHAIETPDLGHTVFVYRDPRDVAVSVAHYMQSGDLDKAIDSMTKPVEKLGVGRYLDFMQAWYYSHAAGAEIRYCDLHDAPLQALTDALKKVAGYDAPESKVIHALGRQILAEAQRRYNDTHHLRHGKVGDWRNSFTREIGRRFHNHFWQLLLDQGFEHNAKWFEGLP